MAVGHAPQNTFDFSSAGFTGPVIGVSAAQFDKPLVFMAGLFNPGMCAELSRGGEFRGRLFLTQNWG